MIEASLHVRETASRDRRPAAGALARTVAAVRARRRRRHAGEVLAVAATAAVVAVGIAAGGSSAPAPAGPTTSSEPSVSATPTPRPTPTPGPSLAPMPGAEEIAAGLGLPASVPAPADLWDRVGAGWVLAVYRPTWELGDGETHWLRNTLMLAAPTGELYRVLELPLDRAVEVVRWEPGDTRALVAISVIDGQMTQTAARGWLDLRTGELTVDPGDMQAASDGCLPQPSFRWTDHDGNEVWGVTYCQTGGGGGGELMILRPDGTQVRTITLGELWYDARLDPTGHRIAVPRDDDADGVAFDVVDLDSGEATRHEYGVPDRYCQVVSWRTDTALLVTCQARRWEFGEQADPEADDLETWEVSVEGAAPRRIMGEAVAPVLEVWSGLPVGDGGVALAGPAVGTRADARCTEGAYLLTGDEFHALPPQGADRVTVLGAAGGLVYAVSSACPDDPMTTAPYELSVWDTTRSPAGDEPAHVLLPAPLPGPAQLSDGLESWAVAGGPSGQRW
ncbi:hypothetical protein CCO02nite_30500 [Cellulomonas composti]|uniref:Uncharacterized protein n=1 Tax=Cellulomonas composti TaxID=266130 RepID=A0A511JEJ5_9CELL|nr:hypothetical protein CCO02nite_30500 [Cellulomonas composti]